MNVLIADDSAEIRKRLREILTPYPEMNIEEAIDCREAVKTHNSLNPDLVICDIQMPHGNGLGVLKIIKSQKSNKAKVIILTNHEEPPYKKRCLELGADYFLVKSSEFGQLPKILEAIVDHHNHSQQKPAVETSSTDYIN